MIKIDRQAVPPPDTLTGKAAATRRQQAKAFFSKPEKSRGQKRFDFSLTFAHPHLRSALRLVFQDKCAYCEKLVDLNEGKVSYLDRFRPTGGAIGRDGKVSIDSYWWLAYEWDNMYACCHQCNRAKGSRFPVSGTRAQRNSRGLKLLLERALLLDPCQDDPSKHLLFSDSGIVSGITLAGRTTVEILQLNRPELLSLREAEANRFAASLDRLAQLPTPESLDRAAPFLLMRRNMLQRRLNVKPALSSLSKAKAQQDKHERKQSDYSSDARTRNLARERAHTRYVEEIVLENIGIHKSLKLKLGAHGSLNAPWMVLLGENGVGKSTLLKAIALALAGQSQWSRIGPHAAALVPIGATPAEQKGTIGIRFSDSQWVRLHIDAGAKSLSGTAHNAKLRMLGFGATRLPSNPDHPPPVEPGHAKLLNLFDPYSPLGDANKWLNSLQVVHFDRASTALKAMLSLDDQAYFSRDGVTVRLHEGLRVQPIESLSDGYQTIIGVGCDIMSVFLDSDIVAELAEGIVLIDEIGNHLHPSWRMRIVRAFKSAFPRIQFIATTHEPLCLRGLNDDEVAVIRRRPDGNSGLLSDLPSIRGLLVDQILSSPHFGLKSTVDPEVEEWLDDYYRLLAKVAPTASERGQMETLRLRLAPFQVIGDSPREQILLRTIDEYLAKAEKKMEVIDPTQVPDELTQDLMGLMEAALPTVRGAA